ncbi:MAG: ABC transporter ATP-binding protein [Arthrobacter sp.]|uniref:ABC transporter ATP-binding protein n=1 Tax=Arthrobacter TaxID=1663 RepID=UPI0026552C4E|nr:ABC transporter ATP-binding protein [Micrococcaceae bacterium]MDN5811906.1 ABC transporter ATP-binding protein [Micrococcaceae bacterium]MDN5824074.1 ABC transporter ATP-binding protein [Micrococcaceae bacterium]MDN5879471.1 ABC transporter ATP-binding protein [Micrococcaceae bacterium]MDN5886865.1 ABC transporter ATP-binding protein [Micrococcaceae bacterium]
MDTQDAPLLTARELVAGYGEFEVCGPLDLVFDRGDALGIVGLNAAGKSTLLRTLIGRQPPLAGTASVLGVFTDDTSHIHRRMISAVFDEDAFFDSLTVEEHLQLIASGHEVPDGQEAVERELEFFELTTARHALPGALSSGQRRRLLLAAGMIRPSELLVLDEPEQRLDPPMRAKLAVRLRARIDDGGAVLLVTHDAILLTTVVDHCLIVDEGLRFATAAEGAAAIGGA